MARVSSCGDLPETQEDLERALNEVNDPELGIGIVDLGLIYRAEWTRGGIEVDFTTTVPSCPYAQSLREQIDGILRKRFQEASAFTVRFVLDPPWKLDRLTESARKTLGWAPSMTSGKFDTSPRKFALRCWSAVGITKH